MHRIDHETRAEDLFGPGKDGFTGGDPEMMIPPTRLTAKFMNAVQEELARAIELGGPLDVEGDNGQLRALLEAWRFLPSAEHEFTATQKFVQSIYMMTTAEFGDAEVLSWAPRSYATLVPLTAFEPLSFGDGQALVTSSGELMMWGSPLEVTMHLSKFIPRSTTVVKVRLQVKPTTVAGGVPLKASFSRITHNMTGTGGANTVGAAYELSAAGGDEILSTAVLADVTDVSTLKLTLVSNEVATFIDPDRVRWVELTYAGDFPNRFY